MRVEVFKAIKKRHAAARINAEPSRTSRFLNLIFLGKPPPRVPLENEKRKIGPYKQHVNLVFIFRCSSTTTNPVCEGRVNLLVYSLSLHRHSYIGFILVFASSIHNKQTKTLCVFQCLVHGIFLEIIMLFSSCSKDSLYPTSRSRATMELSPHEIAFSKIHPSN